MTQTQMTPPIKTTVKITAAKPTDARACYRLCKLCPQLKNPYGIISPAYIGWIQEMTRRRHPVFIAKDGKKTVGFIAGEINTDYALLHLIAVHPHYRRGNIAKVLLRRFEAACWKKTDAIIAYVCNHTLSMNFFDRQQYRRGTPCYEYMRIKTDAPRY